VAALQKTFSGDLTQSIAERIYDEIKKYDEEKRQREADPKVVEAAKEFNKEDNDSLPVVADANTKGVISKIFNKTSSDVVTVEVKVEDVSGKITTIANSMVDQQKLIINQNEMLEEKFGIMLSLLGGGDGSTLGISTGGGRSGGSGKILGQGKNAGDRLAGMFGRAMLMKAFRGAGLKMWRSKLLKRPRVMTKMAKRAGGKFVKKSVQKIGQKIGKKVGAKALTKIAGKGIGKSIAKKIPGVSLVMGAAFAVDRLKDGDILGAGMELLSGAAATVPGWGTAASLGIDAMLMGKDIKESMDFNKGYDAGFKDGQSQGGGYTSGSRTIAGYETGTSGSNIMGFFKQAGSMLVSSVLPVAAITGTLPLVKAQAQEMGLDYPIISLQAPSGVTIGKGRGSTSSQKIEEVERESTELHTPPQISQDIIGGSSDTQSESSGDDNEPRSVNEILKDNDEGGKNQWWDFLDWFPNKGESEGGSVQPVEKLMGGAVVTQRNDPDAEQTGIDVALKNPETGGFDVGAPITNPFEELTITDTGFQGNGEGETGRGYGKWVTGNASVEGKKYELLVAHLDTINVKKGDVVEGGDIIGTQGITGRSTGPHVSTHINALDGGNPQDILNRVEKSWVNGGEISTDAFKPTGGISSNGSPEPPTNTTVKSQNLKLLSSQTEDAEEVQPQQPIIVMNQVTASSTPTIFPKSVRRTNTLTEEYIFLSLGQA
tara:strand:+ start:65 stop:2203 length:2139 start_codon:yes stop_codon:yes gene_type:complete